MALKPPGKIITFYSYKGGTGRTMALANTACLLAQQPDEHDNRPVLMVDWDLEAPGLHRFFREHLSGVTSGVANLDEKLDEQQGLLDLFWKLREATLRYSEEQPQRLEEARELLNQIRPETFILQTDIPGLALLKAGATSDEKYSEKINTFDWEKFYKRAPWLIRSVSERLAKIYRYVLVDSRTGLTDVSGICTMLLPEKLVFVFTLNRQSILGGKGVIERATRYRLKSSDLRPLVVFPLASRVDAQRDDLRDDWRRGNQKKGIEGYQAVFEQFFKDIYRLEHCDLNDYFTEVQIQHSATYAYGEVIAVQAETSSKDDRLSLNRSYRTFTERLVNSQSPWLSKEAESAEDEDSATRTIIFANGKSARAMMPPPDSTAKDVLRSLQLGRAQALFIVVGAGDGLNKEDVVRLSTLLCDSVPRVAADTGAMILDSGARAGTPRMIGIGAADRVEKLTLLGVAPTGRAGVTSDGEKSIIEADEGTYLDPNHTYFVITNGTEWGDEVEMKYDLAREIAKDIPVIAILAGGGQSARKELLRVVDQSWPLIVMEGSGQLANNVALTHKIFSTAESDKALDALQKLRQLDQGVGVSDALLTEIIGKAGARANIKLFPREGSQVEFEQLIHRSLPSGKVIEKAWRLFATLDAKASKSHKMYSRLQTGFIILGCLGVIVALASPALKALGYDITSVVSDRVLGFVFSFLMALVATTYLLNNLWQLGPGATRISHAAEAIKSEISQYRSQAGKYSALRAAQESPELEFETMINTFLVRFKGLSDLADSNSQAPHLMPDDSSFIKKLALGLDNGFSSLTPEQYVSTRLEDQLTYQRARLRKFIRQRGVTNILIVVLTTAGGVLSASLSGGAVLGAMMMTLALALAALMGIRQIEKKAQIAGILERSLSDILAWWKSLTNEEKSEQKNIDTMVNDTENALSLERGEHGTVASIELSL